MKSKTLPMMLCSMYFLAACNEWPQTQGPLVQDVITEPPLTEQTARYLVRNDRPMAEWVAYIVSLCNEHGCA